MGNVSMRRFPAAIFAALLVFIFFQSFILLKNPAVGWDESVYIGMGKYIFSGGKAGLWEYVRPPVFPIFLGLFWFFGLDVLPFGRLLAFFFSILYLLATYLAGREVFGKKEGVLSVAILLTTPLFLTHSSKILTGIPSTTFSLLSLLFLFRKSYFVSGLLSGVAFLTRFPLGILLFLIPIFIISGAFEKRKMGIVLFLAGVLVIVPYVLFNLPSLANAHASMYDEEYLWVYEKPLLFYLYSIPLENPIFIFSIPALFFLVKRKNENPKALFLFLTVCTLLFYFTLIPHREIRFAIPLLPFLAVLSSHTILKIYERVGNKGLKFIFFLTVFILVFNQLVTILSSFNLKPEKNFLEGCSVGEGVIMSSLPHVSKYVDNRVVGFPDFYSVEKALPFYEKNRERVDYIVYSKACCPCRDKECEEKRERLLEKLKEENRIICIANGTFEFPVYVFSTSG